MFSDGPSDPPSADALEALGCLREILSAVGNLEHLALSRTVGPKLLEQVLPDVSVQLGKWESAARILSVELTRCLQLQEGALSDMTSGTLRRTTALSESIRELGRGSLFAKQRLTLERVLRAELPALSSVVRHFEMLLSAVGRQAVPMSVEELMTSAPEKGSDRPYLPLWVQGPVADLNVLCSARTVLTCLAALRHSIDLKKNALEPEAAGDQATNVAELGLLVSAGGSGKVHFSFQRVTPSGLRAKLPIFPSGKYSPACIQAALRPSQGSIDVDRGCLHLQSWREAAHC